MHETAWLRLGQTQSQYLQDIKQLLVSAYRKTRPLMSAGAEPEGW